MAAGVAVGVGVATVRTGVGFGVGGGTRSSAGPPRKYAATLITTMATTIPPAHIAMPPNVGSGVPVGSGAEPSGPRAGACASGSFG